MSEYFLNPSASLMVSYIKILATTYIGLVMERGGIEKGGAVKRKER